MKKNVLKLELHVNMLPSGNSNKELQRCVLQLSVKPRHSFRRHKTICVHSEVTYVTAERNIVTECSTQLFKLYYSTDYMIDGINTLKAIR